MACRGVDTEWATDVADAMLARPKVCSAELTVAEARAEFADDHVHAVLVVEAGVLLAVVERGDLGGAPADAPARRHGRLRDRVVRPGDDLGAVREAMVATGQRRLAVVDAHGVLLGLLCLKRSGRGFCSQADVDARARERAGTAT